jgi:hypothetical protein
MVPKDWKTHRTIAMEPAINLYFQEALDRLIRKKLRSWSIDLNDQSGNQRLAIRGSLTGMLATIDLSAASDTLSFELVRFILPTEWFELMCRTRVSFYKLRRHVTKKRPVNKIRHYEKFSSMGNALTFSLETLIFAALMRATGSTTTTAYGDDLIVDSQKAELAIGLLKFAGFTPNAEKSYFTGPFRESCGVDVYSGEAITPIYLREWQRGAFEKVSKPDLCHVVNSLFHSTWAKANFSLYMPLWKELVGIINENRLKLVPYNPDTRSGVWVDLAYQIDFRKRCWIRNKAGSVQYYGYHEKPLKMSKEDQRSADYRWRWNSQAHRLFWYIMAEGKPTNMTSHTYTATTEDLTYQTVVRSGEGWRTLRNPHHYDPHLSAVSQVIWHLSDWGSE